MPVIDQATPQGFANLRVWGVSVQEIGQANDLAGKNIKVFGGMQKGLPLAKPQQSGLLVQGYVFQAFGNWIGVDMTLDIVIAPGSSPTGGKPGGGGTLRAPKNIVLNWKAGTPIGAALKTTLETAFPGYTVKVATSPDVVPSTDQVGFYPTLEQLTQFAGLASLSINKDPKYAGVGITFGPGNVISVSDGTVAPPAGATPTQIAFEDMIGQPTWIERPNIQVKTVMRADLQVDSRFKLPPTLIQNTAQAESSLVNQRVSFQGGFSVISLRHVGHFRQPSADAWCTIIEGTPLNPLQPGPLILATAGAETD